MNANEILTRAAGHLADRAKTYDKPQGERSMKATVEAFKAVTGNELTETQGWLFMALLKAVRSQQGEFKLDSFEDGAAYFALAGESASEANSGFTDRTDKFPPTLMGEIAPSWNDAPEWAQWLAKSINGVWVWFEKRPRPFADKYWLFSGGKTKDYFMGKKTTNWRNTLQQRPESKK